MALHRSRVCFDMVMTDTPNQPNGGQPMYSSYKEAKAARPWFKKKRFWLLIIVVIIIIASVAGGGGGSDSDEPASTTPVTDASGSTVPTTAKPEDVEISFEEFQQIQNGMTYDEVKTIIGGDGSLSSETNIGDIATQSYTYDGPGLGDNAILIFQDGELTSKTQYGLEAD